MKVHFFGSVLTSYIQANDIDVIVVYDTDFDIRFFKLFAAIYNSIIAKNLTRKKINAMYLSTTEFNNPENTIIFQIRAKWNLG